MTDPVVRRLPPLPVYGSPPLDDARPFVMHDEQPLHLADVPDPEEPATRAQAERLIALLTDIRDQLARAFGAGR